MDLEEAIATLDHLFEPNRFPSYKEEWLLIVETARLGQSLKNIDEVDNIRYE